MVLKLVTTSKICKKCNTLHRHNIIITQNDNIYFLPVARTKYFELSSETVFTKELLYDFGVHFLKYGMGAESYADMYNERNEVIIQHTKKKMEKIGHRSNTIKLERNKLSSAFFLFFAIHYIYTYDVLKYIKITNPYNSELINLNTETNPFEPSHKKRKLNDDEDNSKINDANIISFNDNNSLICITKELINIEKNKFTLYSNIMSKKIKLFQLVRIVWKGKVEFAKETWCLINLNYPIGFTDGSVWGFVYKTGIKKNHGLFLPEKYIDFQKKKKTFCINRL